jgi:hypothetical protein
MKPSFTFALSIIVQLGRLKKSERDPKPLWKSQ